MELVTYDVPRRRADHEPLTIIPLGDIQWNGKNGPTALDILKRTIDDGLERNAFFIGMGDYIDFMSPSNRQKLRVAGFYDNTEDVIDEKAMELTHEIYELALKPTKGRWLGMLEGHHFSHLKSGDTTDMRLCQMLNTRFLGSSAIVRIVFDVCGSRITSNIWCHHGQGGGASQGGPLNKLAGMAGGFEQIDVMIMGHTCKMPADKLERVYVKWDSPDGPTLVKRTIALVNSGGFAKSLVVGNRQGQVPRGTYAEVGMMKPVPLGAPKIHITPRIVDHRIPGNRSKRKRYSAHEITVEV